LGKVLGANWEKYHGLMTKYLVIIGLLAATIIIIVYFYRKYKQNIHEWIINTLRNSIKLFNSLGKIKALIAGKAAYLFFFSLIGLSSVFFNIQYPSDVAAGFEFGIVWLSLSIILLEIYRILPELRNQNHTT
jgi:hypothetical protein